MKKLTRAPMVITGMPKGITKFRLVPPRDDESQVYSEYVHWSEPRRRMVLCGLPCSICDRGDRRILRVFTNIILHGEAKVKTWAFGKALFNKLHNITNTYQRELVCKRTGTGPFTKYELTTTGQFVSVSQNAIDTQPHLVLDLPLLSDPLVRVAKIVESVLQENVENAIGDDPKYT